MAGKLFLTLLFVFATLAPGAKVLATFAPPRLYEPATVMEGLKPVTFTYGDAVQLLGIAVDQERVAPGERLAVRACWVGLRPIETSYTVFVHLIGPENSRVAERHTYPGLGRFPTPLWPVGQAFCDTYRMQVKPWAETPVRYQLELGLYDAETGQRPPTMNAAGIRIAPPIVSSVSVIQDKDARPSLAHPITNTTLGDSIALRGYDIPDTVLPGNTITITLYWEALSTPGKDFTAFVHLWQPGSPAPIAQHDAQPRRGWFPTHVWQAGDWVPDAHSLTIPADLPPGHYLLWAGLYDTTDSIRLPTTGPEGRYPYDLVPLGEMAVRHPSSVIRHKSY